MCACARYGEISSGIKNLNLNIFIIKFFNAIFMVKIKNVNNENKELTDFSKYQIQLQPALGFSLKYQTRPQRAKLPVLGRFLQADLDGFAGWQVILPALSPFVYLKFLNIPFLHKITCSKQVFADRLGWFVSLRAILSSLTFVYPIFLNIPFLHLAINKFGICYSKFL